MTHRKLLKEISDELKKAGIESADLDARVLVKFVLKIDENVLFKNLDQTVNKKAASKIQELASRRTSYEPVAYLTKHKEFFNLNFYVNENVLIPRPETEYLVEESIKFLKSIKRKQNIIDIGTGSGNIIISIVKSLDKLSTQQTFDFFATDISSSALKIAIHNAKQNGVYNKINFLESDLFSNKDLPEKFDLIVANLPYVPENEVDSSVKFEPKNAIFAQENGTKIIKKFLLQARDHINANGLIIIELDPRNALELKIFASETFAKKAELEKDLAENNRYLLLQN